MKPSKVAKGFMQPQLKSVNNRALKPASMQEKKKPQVSERQQRPQLPRFRIPSLPTLRMPQLPRLRRPTFRPITFNNPFARPSRPSDGHPGCSRVQAIHPNQPTDCPSEPESTG